MLPRGRHYESAFASRLRAERIPFLSVDEARRTLLPANRHTRADLKSFDFIVYGPTGNLLIDVKGRRGSFARSGRAPSFRGECWVTRQDVESMAEWERLFGPGFEAAFAFLYWCDEQPPDGVEAFQFQSRWYLLRLAPLRDYARAMRPRSPRWNTVSLPRAAFEALDGSLAARLAGRASPLRWRRPALTPSF